MRRDESYFRRPLDGAHAKIDRLLRILAMVDREVCAARVAQVTPDGVTSKLLSRARHLAEIHAPARSLPIATVGGLLEGNYGGRGRGELALRALHVEPEVGHAVEAAAERCESRAAVRSEHQEARRRPIPGRP